MKITVDWDVLQREHIPIGDFLVLLMGYYGAGYKNPSSQSPIALAAIIHLHILPQFWLYGKTLRQFGGRIFKSKKVKK